MTLKRRELLKTAAVTVAGATLGATRARAAVKPVRIGYSFSGSGPYKPISDVTVLPDYRLWVEQVNAAGGLLVKDQGKRPIEVLAVDDKSDPDAVVKIYEKFCTQDKVDLLFAPTTTHLNFSVAPVVEQHKYCVLASTMSSLLLEEKRYRYLYAALAQPKELMQAWVDLLVEMKKQGQVKKLSLIHQSDLFGIELAKCLTGLANGHFDFAFVERYPLTTSNFSALISRAKKEKVDAFLAITYPPDLFAMTKEAQVQQYSPPVFMGGVGTASTFYRDLYKGAEGVMGIAGWNPHVKYAGAKEFHEAHVKLEHQEPDRWGSAYTYAGLQMLEKCVNTVGLDHEKIKGMLDSTEFQTVAGPIRFKDRQNSVTPGMVGQWQNGEFEIVWPLSVATAKLVPVKPAWKT